MDDDWKPHKIKGPGDDDNDGNKRKAKIVFLPIPEELKQKGLKNIIYARTFISIDYNGRLFTFTIHKEDITKTQVLFDKALDHEVDAAIRGEIWFKCIAANWLKHVYTEHEIEMDAIGGIGDAEGLLELAKENSKQIFKDEYKVAHAAVMINEHLEILPIGEIRFKNWLRKTVRKECNAIVRSQLIEEVVNTLIADVDFDGQPCKELGLRIASSTDNELKWYYDLTNDPHEYIEITSEGWKIAKNAIIFRRFDHQKQQDYPTAAQDYPADIFDQFMDLLNVKKENRLILKCYIVSLFIPNLQKAVLMVHGEQGTAKSMLEELLKMLADPSIIKTLSFPKDLAELVQQLSHHSLTYYDNLSRIPEWISDLLCRATTGSGFSKRRLYTNDQDVVYSIMRAIGFNGINLAATKADLLDRGIIIQTDTIPKGNRRKIKAIWDKFYSIRPQLLAYILNTLVKAIKWKNENPKVELIKELPRMADWAEWCELISRCMGESDNAFINAYNDNVNLQTEEVIEGSDLAIVVRLFAADKQDNWEFRDTPTAVLVHLNLVADANNIDRRSKYWPKTAARLSRSLKLLQRTLREIDIEIQWDKDRSTQNNTRIIVIRKLPSEPSDRPITRNQAQNLGNKLDDTNQPDSKLLSDNELLSDKKTENRAQNRLSDGRTASDDTFRIDVKKLMKCEGVLSGNKSKLVYDAEPATGALYVTEKNPSFISGEIRMRGKDGGSYPYNYLEMIDKLFGPDNDTIEVCSHSVKGVNLGGSCFTVDINPDCNPDLAADGQTLADIPDNKFSRWRCDPPYNAKTAKKMYGTELHITAKLLQEGARICKPGSLMFLLLSQNYQHCPVGVKRIGRISISVIPNNEERVLNIFLKLQ